MNLDIAAVGRHAETKPSQQGRRHGSVSWTLRLAVMCVTSCVRRRNIGSGCGRNVYDILGRTGLAVPDDMVSVRASYTYDSGVPTLLFHPSGTQKRQ